MGSALIHFCCTALSSSLAVFLPTILRSFAWDRDKANYMTVPVFLTGAVVAILNGVASDRMKIRYPFCAIPILISIVACVIPLADKHINSWTSYATIVLLTAGNFSAQTTAMTWLGNNLYGRRHRGLAFGFVAGVGNVGFILGTHIYLEDQRPRYITGRAVSLALSLLALISATIQLLFLLRKQNRVRVSQQVEKTLRADDADTIWGRAESFPPGTTVY